MATEEKHPFLEYEMSPEITKLYIGTFPPYRLTDKNKPDLSSIDLNDNDVCFFYGSNRSLFWPIMQLATGTQFIYKNTLDAVNERIKFLNENLIGLTDVYKEAQRKGTSAKDQSLSNPQFNDILNLIHNKEKLYKIFFSSKNAFRYFNDYLLSLGYSPIKDGHQTFKTNNKEYKIKILQSPTGQVVGNPLNLIDLIKQYKEEFIECTVNC